MRKLVQNGSTTAIKATVCQVGDSRVITSAAGKPSANASSVAAPAVRTLVNSTSRYSGWVSRAMLSNVTGRRTPPNRPDVRNAYEITSMSGMAMKISR
ncbi:unannotated protein [freshwater metagenome]|uniref:Unannotated protein n=1 Tax=freshwater metagenome TaxID=449393 RepID=A0A6J7L7T7_9ZZZZ